MGRPKVALINRPAAVEIALDMIDTIGLDAFSMRRLAQRLDVNVASLYHHFQDKEDLFLRVHQLILTEIPSPSPRATWQETLLRTSVDYRRTLIRHWRALPLMSRLPASQSVPILWKRYGDELVSHGVHHEVVPILMNSCEVLVFGSLTLDIARAQANGDGDGELTRKGVAADEKSFEQLCSMLITGMADAMEDGSLRQRTRGGAVSTKEPKAVAARRRRANRAPTA